MNVHDLRIDNTSRGGGRFSPSSINFRFYNCTYANIDVDPLYAQYIVHAIWLIKVVKGKENIGKALFSQYLFLILERQRKDELLTSLSLRDDLFYDSEIEDQLIIVRKDRLPVFSAL